jgi:hypothetical protein
MTRTKKIIRTPTRAEGGLTDAEREAMAIHTQKWIANAMRTDKADPEKLGPAICRLYAAAGLKAPRVILVPSPRVMAFAGGFSAAIWHRRGVAATDDATYAATDDATRAATYDATDDGKLFLRIAQELLGNDASFGLRCAANWGSMYQGGNMWSAWDCYLTAARDVLGLNLPPHEKYAAWEECAQLGGFRLMHPEFCMVSDFPERLSKDEQNRPHCDDGPSHRWRDGWSLWFIHGVAVTEQIVMRPDTLTIAQIDGETNAEVRRVMIQRYGIARYVQESGAEVVHELPDNYFLKGLQGARLLRKPRPGDSDLIVCQVRNSTPEPDGSVKPYFLRIDPRAYGGEAARNCHAAIASTFRMPDDHKVMAYAKWQDYRPGFES